MNFGANSPEEVRILRLFSNRRERSVAKAKIWLRREAEKEVPIGEDLDFYRVFLGVDRLDYAQGDDCLCRYCTLLLCLPFRLVGSCLESLWSRF
uniref:Uncharacterized protein n=1 Tax=Chromera velia CCMP2878 TaxID=1169474 RepID=A0A0G4HWN3_9ALVE|mmetsp:Transcript_47471/g.93587  ORF Transcript_47471/g.93587 Transcript_47471/m.93587 type:complete len:94 (+) Transcript_47471:400-681(+)|eukprot:Cvel_9104.t1-p1 / transcript=Cvel_9104.t1 / gene=Cvel_9104 / organism=Chromera_velia_CCMP2878 / gene_product=hypothetical protein / transcript_product=hypothetical protein / location=Cvel_scaffold517:10699-11894(-) / protein_length=93 / sequence_SO=supercontig / SO=protein_coding / is_pseudo=false